LHRDKQCGAGDARHVTPFLLTVKNAFEKVTFTAEEPEGVSVVATDEFKRVFPNTWYKKQGV